MKLAVLGAGVRSVRQLGQERTIELPSGQLTRKHARIEARYIGNQSAVLNEEAIWIHNRYAVLSGRPNDHISMTACEAIGHDHDPAMCDFGLAGNDRFNVLIISHRCFASDDTQGSARANETRHVEIGVGSSRRIE